MSLGKLRNIITTMIVIGILLGVSLVILREFTTKFDSSSSGGTNITFVVAEGFAEDNRTAWNCYSSFELTEVFNETGILDDNSTRITSGNWTYTPASGAILIPNQTTLLNFTTAQRGVNFNETWLITYTFDYSNSSGCEAIQDTINATMEIPSWLGIVVVLFIIVIIIGIIFKVMPKTGSGEFGKSGGGMFNRIKGGKGFGGGDSGGTAEI